MVFGDILASLNGLVYGDIILAVIIFASSIIVSKLIYVFIERFIGAYAAQTKTTIDDEILKAIRKPLYFGIIIVGSNFALSSINVLKSFSGLITQMATLILILLGVSVTVKMVNILIRLSASEIAQRTHTKIDDKFLPIFSKMSKLVIYSIALMLILSEFGIQITPLLAGLGIGGLAVALALQPTLSNFFSGTYILTDGSIKIGDYIELQEMGTKGYVDDIGWRSTKIRTLPNNIVIVPNAKLADSVVTNYYAPTTDMALVVPVGVSYESDLEKVEKITVEVAKKVLKDTPGGVKDFEPFIRYSEFGDSNINFSVILRVQTFVDQYLVKHEFIKQLKKHFDKEGIEISYPARSVYFKTLLKRA